MPNAKFSARTAELLARLHRQEYRLRLASAVFAGAFPLLSAASRASWIGSTEQAWLFWGSLAAGGVSAAVNVLLTRFGRRLQYEESIEQRLQTALDHVSAVLRWLHARFEEVVTQHDFPPGELRINLMIADTENQQLQISVGTQGYSPAELSLLWSFNQGCCGQAAVRRREVSLLRKSGTKVPTSYAEWLESPEAPYAMNEEQWRYTHNLNTVVSVPIVSQDQIVLVLNVDDTRFCDSSPILHPDGREVLGRVRSYLDLLLNV